MSKLRKIFSVIHRKNICLLDGINNHKFTSKYYKYLSAHGVKFTGRPNYIAANAYLDGAGLDLITIGKDVVISREVMLLTHDFSVETALHAIGKGTEERRLHINKPITIGDNSFIGARASLLPGTEIGKNCIVGACCVVKGKIPDNSIVVGNPCKIIGRTDDLAHKYENNPDVLG